MAGLSMNKFERDSTRKNQKLLMVVTFLQLKQIDPEVVVVK